MMPNDEELLPATQVRGWREIKVGPCASKQAHEHAISANGPEEKPCSEKETCFHQSFHSCGLIISW